MTNFPPTLWLSLIAMVLTYGLLGWQLSAYHVFWSLLALIVVMILVGSLMWGDKMISRMMRMGPQGVVTIFLLSSIMTLAVAASTLFGELLILLATQSLAYLEFQTAGFNRSITLVILWLIGSSALSGGWCIGETLYPSTPLWLSAS
jgi:hypothetical protein